MQDIKAIRDVEKCNKFTKRFTIHMQKLKDLSYYKDIIRYFINSNYSIFRHNTNYNEHYISLPDFFLSQKKIKNKTNKHF
jgi:hypothetical protein